MNVLPMSIAYSVWTGIGAIGAVGVGVIFNGEKVGVKKGVYLFLIIFSVIMLKLI
jgi:paired small multidrug resistance pump